MTKMFLCVLAVVIGASLAQIKPCRIEGEEEFELRYELEMIGRRGKTVRRRRCEYCRNRVDFLVNALGKGLCIDQESSISGNKKKRLQNKCAIRIQRLANLCQTPEDDVIAYLNTLPDVNCTEFSEGVKNAEYASWDEWSDWGDCSVECGSEETGTRKKTRGCTKRGEGFDCLPENGIEGEMFEECNAVACPTLESKWGDWTEWDECSAECGGGIRTKTRVCNDEGAGKCGPDGTGFGEIATEACAMDPCKVDGKWGEWKTTECDAVCGEANKIMLRECVGQANGGDACTCIEDECFCEDDNYLNCQMQKRIIPCDLPACPVDECAETPDLCGENAVCLDTAESYVCTCLDGYEDLGEGCVDRNECAIEPPICGDPNSVCENSVASYDCLCKDGFSRPEVTAAKRQEEGQGEEGEGEEEEGEEDDLAPCVDIDECTAGTHECDENAECINNEGGYTCTCNAGFDGTGYQCEDIDECDQDDACADNASCTDFEGGYGCSCDTGYTGMGKVSCEDRDECKENPNICGSEYEVCVNVEASYQCDCIDGLVRDEADNQCKKDGVWSEYGAWSSCSVDSCGGGIRTKTRVCIPPRNGGAPCDPANPDLMEETVTEACNTDPCPVDGVMHQWSSWGECSVNCGSGHMSRSRTCDPPMYGGHDVCTDSALHESKLCTRPNCPRLKMYEDVYYRGARREVTTSQSWIGSDWNDKVSSVHAYGGEWTLYKNSNYDEWMIHLCAGETRPRLGKYNDEISSVKYRSGISPECAEGGAKIVFFTDESYHGYPKTLIHATRDLHRYGMGDNAESLRVVNGNWRLYEHKNWTGRSKVFCKGTYITDLGDIGFKDKFSSAEICTSCCQ